MKRIFILSFLGMLSVMIFCGCISSGFKSQSGVIELKGNPTTGYTWSYRIEGDEILSVDEEVTYLGKDGIVGAPSKFEYRIKSLKPGEAKIRFSYSRPWLEGSETDSKIFLIKIADNGNIEIKEVE